MKKIMVSLIFSVLALTKAYAEVEVPYIGTAEQLWIEAQGGQREFIEALLRLKDHVRELRDQETFERFFLLLDKFEVLSEDYTLDSIYPGLVSEVGTAMVRHGNRWLRVAKDSSEKIMSYQKWANLSVAYSFQSQIIEEIQRLKEGAEFKKAQENLLVLHTWAQNNFPEDLYLVSTYSSVLADLSFKALVNTPVEQEENWEFWLKGLKTQSVIQDYIYYLTEKFLSEELSQASFSYWQSLVYKLGLQQQSLNLNADSSRLSYGTLVIDLMSQAISGELAIDEKQFEAVVDLLTVSSFRSLVYLWVKPGKIFSDSYGLSLIPLTQILLDKAQALNKRELVMALQTFMTDRLITSFIVQNSLEGTYVLEGDKYEWRFTLMRETEDRLVAGLCTTTEIVCFSFFNLKYEASRKVFLASERSPDDSSEPNMAIQISFKEDKTLEIELPPLLGFSERLSGVKVESYENLMEDPDLNADYIEGLYSGTITYLDGRERQAELKVFNFGNYTMARLVPLNKSYTISFSKGSDGNMGFVYLTSGKLSKGSFLHLRLQQSDEGVLSGSLISSGKGRVAHVEFSPKLM